MGLADEASAGMGIEEGRSRLFRRSVSSGGGLNLPAEEVVLEPAADCLCFSASPCDTAQYIKTGPCGIDCRVIHVNTYGISKATSKRGLLRLFMLLYSWQMHMCQEQPD